MTTRPFFVLAVVATLFHTASLQGQDLSIKKIEIDGERVYATYDLIDSTLERTYTINLYSSRDNFITPLKNVKGALGLEVPPGTNKVIEWNAREELGADFNDKVSLELRAKVYVPFIRLDEFPENKKFVRGRTYEILWRGGRPQNVLNFDLYKGETKVHTFSNIANEGKYTLIFPMRTRPGKDYHFRISDNKNRDEVVNTGNFRIAPKIPLAYKFIPVVGLGAVIYFWTINQKDCDGCLPDFPGAPKKN